MAAAGDGTATRQARRRSCRGCQWQRQMVRESCVHVWAEGCEMGVRCARSVAGRLRRLVVLVLVLVLVGCCAGRCKG